MSTGLLSWLVDNWPEASFTIATSPACAPLLEAFPRLRETILVRKKRHHRHWLDLWKATFGTGWDLVVDLRGSMLSYFLRARQRYIFRVQNKQLHKSEQLAALFGLSPPPPTRLWVSKPARAVAQALLPADTSSLVVLAPVSNAAFKDWPAERYAQVAKTLATHGVLIGVLALESQRASLAPLLAAIPAAQKIDLIGKTSLPVAMAVLERTRLFIGNDSGLLQMAAALGTQCIGLYGPTNHMSYGPRGPHVHLITTHTFKPGEREINDGSLIRRIKVETVLEKTLPLLGIKA